MVSVVFRVIGCPRVLAASSAAEMTQQIMQAANTMPRATSVSLQIAMPCNWGDGLDWGDMCLVPRLGRWRCIPLKTMIQIRRELWEAMVVAHQAWQQQKRFVDAFADAVAAPAPLYIVGRQARSRSFEYTDKGWREIIEP